MKKGLLLTFMSAFVVTIGFSQSDKFWSVNTNSRSIVKYKAVERLSFPKEFLAFNLNTDAIRQQLFTVVGRAGNPSTVITLPNASGEMEQFEVFEASNFEPALQAQFPDIRAYSGRGITDKHATLKLSISPQGIQTMVFRTETANEFIEPYSSDRTVYAVFRSNRDKGSLPWACTTEEQNFAKSINTQLGGTTASATGNSAGSIKTLRLAQSCNGEYANYFGATSASQVGLVMAAYNATLTRTNGCYEKDLALHLDLIANTTSVIYYSPSTDPYSTQLSQWNLQLQQTLTNVIGSANYDIGHMFGATGGGGNAGCIGCVCVNPATSNSLAKGAGITSPADGIPEGDNFDIDYVAHEVGHQLGGNHTFSHSLEGTGQNKEIGSGITIMGYAGITAQDVANHSIDVFHETTIAQIQANMATKTCPVTTSMTANHAPVVTGPGNFTIPISTPFALTASATDAENDPLTYNWEQNDNSTTSGTGSVASPTKATGPNWISFPSVASGTRTFPRLSTILAGANVTGPLTGGDAGVNTEALSSVSRTLNFRVTVRDNVPYVAGQTIGQTGFTDAVVTVSNTSGPFAVTSPNTNITWPADGQATVTWSVNNTTLAPVSCASVNILLSADGGQTFTTVLASGTANDGSETITVPSAAGNSYRVKVESVGNIFFDISNTNFTIGAPPACGTPSGLAASNITQTSATVSWSTLSGALNYDVDYKATSSGTWINAATATSATSVNLSSLTASTTYDYRVRATCSGGTGGYAQAQFTTTGTVVQCPGQYDISTNNSVSGAATIPLNTDVYGRIEVKSDLDHYRFSVATGGSVTITLQTLPADYQLALLNSAGTVLQSSANTGTNNESITRTLTAGTYYARVTAKSKNIFNASSCYTLRVQSATGKNEGLFVQSDRLAVSPNPAGSTVNLAFTAARGNGTITIVDQAGAVVLRSVIAVEEGYNKKSLNVSALPSGMYFVKVQSGNYIQMAKLVISK